MPSPIDDEILQRFHDGDLSPAETRGLSLRIASDPAAQRRLRELARLGELVRDAAQQASEELDSDALFRAIEARLPQRAAPSIMPPAPSNVRPLRRKHAWVPALAASAVAAAALVVALRMNQEPEPYAQTADPAESVPEPGEQPDEPQQIASKESALNKQADGDEGGQLRPEPTEELGATYDALGGVDTDAALVSTAQGSQLERVDFGRNAGTAFVMKGLAIGVTVVWLNETNDGDAQ